MILESCLKKKKILEIWITNRFSIYLVLKNRYLVFVQKITCNNSLISFPRLYHKYKTGNGISQQGGFQQFLKGSIILTLFFFF
jgi:hypothetical protein